MKRMINVQEVSEYICFYSTDLNSYVTGETLSVSEVIMKMSISNIAWK